MVAHSGRPRAARRLDAHPLAGWSGWRWSGLVLIGTSPEGREWSLGEVLASARNSWALFVHPVTGRGLRRLGIQDVEQGTRAVERWVRELGGGEVAR